MSASDPTMTDDLERRLSAWMDGQQADVNLTASYDAIVDTTRGTGQRPWLLVRPSVRRSTAPSQRSYVASRAAAVGLAVLLLVLALVAGGLVASRLLRMTPTPPALAGFISSTGPLPPGALVRPAIASLADGRVLVAGGTNSGTDGWAWVYDPTSGTYGARIAMRALRQGASATTLLDGTVLVAGGRPYRHDAPVATAEIFDPRSDAFAPTGSMAVARDGHTATLLQDGRVLVAGGTGTIGAVNGGFDGGRTTASTAEIYDPASGQFGPPIAMPEGRAGHAATLLPDGRVLITGGYGIGSGSCSMQLDLVVFDPQTQRFSVIGKIGTPRVMHTATLLADGRVLLAGGLAGPEQSSECPDVAAVLAGAELVDPSSGTFVPTSPLVTERFGQSATLLADGRVLIAGGTNKFGSPRSAELYQPSTGTFVPAATAGDEHLFGSAPKLPDGRVLLAGPEAGSELFDPTRTLPVSTNAGGPVPIESGRHRAVDMTDQRTGHVAIRLRDGRVLVAGGSGGANNDRLASAELFDPATKTFRPVGAMASAREGDATYVGFVATMRPDGRVLVVGGSAGLETAEIYDPATESFSPAPQFATALQLGAPNPAEGLPGGSLLLESFPDDTTRAVTGLDGATARPGPTGTVCPLPPGMEVAQDTVGLPDGRALFLCGSTSPEIFDPRDGSTAAVTVSGDWVRALPLHDGRVLLAGADGTQVDDPAAFRPVAIVNPVTGRLEELSTTAAGGSLIALPDGRLLLVGGAANHPGASATLLDSVTGETRDVGPLLTPRQEPSLTVLQDGQVLIVGGAIQSADRTVPMPPGAELLDLSP